MRPAKPKYKFAQCVREDHGKPIFSVQFNPFVKYHMFASVGANRITVYKIIDNQLRPVLCLADPNVKEHFYCCTWAIDFSLHEVVLLAAGNSGIIRIISTSCPQSIKYLSGHGGAINDLKVSPVYQELVLSSSKDHSIRLWNIRTEACIAIFGGVEGHRDEVLSCDFHCTGTRIISCGMDHSLKIWNFTPDVMAAIELSKQFNDITARKSFPTVRKHFPTFSTRDIHRNYVDCVAWYGNFILSKSCENSIVCWRPGKLESSADLSLPTKYTTDTTCSILENFDVKQCDIWFLRFSIDSGMKYLALGNKIGKIYVIDLDSHDHDSKPAEKATLSHPKCQSAIRQTCFSNDASMLICSCEDGTLWRWDLSL
jgi:polycomb protein EED